MCMKNMKAGIMNWKTVLMQMFPERNTKLRQYEHCTRKRTKEPLHLERDGSKVRKGDIENILQKLRQIERQWCFISLTVHLANTKSEYFTLPL